MEKISVAIRVRPPIKQELVRGSQWKVGARTISMCNALGVPVLGQSYTFDHVFPKEATNSNVYEVHAKDLILSALQGFNGTIFAYGQTSSGKTYTMRGSERDPGIIHRSICDIFGNIEKICDREFLIRVSYMEIYKEEINDLLAPENRKLRIHENSVRGVFVAGLREEIVNSPEQVFEFLNSGETNRHFGKTNMNVYSSRSHTIFRMVIESRDKTNICEDDALDAVRVSTLNLVDLAGSERISKTGAGGVRLKEGTHINKSLMTLGTVINKLSEATGKQGGHIPYRNSKLTRILQSALDGNAKTAVICTITPDEMQLDETRGTLQFASRAKKVPTCAQINETITDAALLKRQKKEIEVLRKKLQGTRSEILEKEILNLRNDLLKFELERERLTLELEEEKKAQKERELRIQEQERKIENLSTLVISSAWDERKPARKSTRRETWCPLSATPDSHRKEFKDESPLVSARKDMIPVAFEMLFNEEAQGNIASVQEPQPELDPLPPDFENVADEETWINMNRGYVPADGPSSESLSSSGSDTVPINISKELALSELESMKDTLVSKEEELVQIRMQLDASLKEQKRLEDDLATELRLQADFELVILDLERQLADGKFHVEDLQEVLRDFRDALSSSFHETKDLVCTMMLTFSDEHCFARKAQINLIQGLKSITPPEESDMERQPDKRLQRVDVNDQCCSTRRMTRTSSTDKRFSELKKNEEHLKQLLQRGLLQLLNTQNVNQLLFTENSSLLSSKTKLQNAVDVMHGKLEVLRDRIRESDARIQQLLL